MLDRPDYSQVVESQLGKTASFWSKLLQNLYTLYNSGTTNSDFGNKSTAAQCRAMDFDQETPRNWWGISVDHNPQCGTQCQRFSFRRRNCGSDFKILRWIAFCILKRLIFTIGTAVSRHLVQNVEDFFNFPNYTIANGIKNVPASQVGTCRRHGVDCRATGACDLLWTRFKLSISIEVQFRSNAV